MEGDGSGKLSSGINDVITETGCAVSRSRVRRRSRVNCRATDFVLLLRRVVHWGTGYRVRGILSIRVFCPRETTYSDARDEGMIDALPPVCFTQ